MLTSSQCLPIKVSDFIDIPDVRFYDERWSDSPTMLGFTHKNKVAMDKFITFLKSLGNDAVLKSISISPCISPCSDEVIKQIELINNKLTPYGCNFRTGLAKVKCGYFIELLESNDFTDIQIMVSFRSPEHGNSFCKVLILFFENAEIWSQFEERKQNREQKKQDRREKKEKKEKEKVKRREDFLALLCEDCQCKKEEIIKYI